MCVQQIAFDIDSLLTHIECSALVISLSYTYIYICPVRNDSGLSTTTYSVHSKFPPVCSLHRVR